MAKKKKNKTFDRFQILKKIGEGSTGEVFRIKDPILKREIALKILHPDITERAGIARLRNQFYLMAQLKDPRVVPIVETGYSEGKLWCAMELLENGTLEETDIPVPAEKACEILMEVASALEFIHAQGISHLDLKPANIFRGEENLMLADFGLTGDRSEKISGTPAYIAPEIISGDHFDFRADLYSLGVIALEFIAGENPFESESPAESIKKQLEYKPSIPKLGKKFDRFRTLIDRLLAKTADERPPSAYSVRIELQDILGIERKPGESYYLPEGPFIDRQEQIERIVKLWEDSNLPRFISVNGEIGVGKTTFCRRAREEIEKKGGKTAYINTPGEMIGKLIAPYTNDENKAILQQHLPGLLYEIELPEELIEDLEIEPSLPPDTREESITRIVEAIEALTRSEGLFVVSLSGFPPDLVEGLRQSKANIFVLLDDGDIDEKVKLEPIEKSDLQLYLRGIFGEIDGEEDLANITLEQVNGNFSDTRNLLRDYVRAGALIPEAYQWKFIPKAVPNLTGLESRWEELDVSDRILATAVALEGTVDFKVLERLMGPGVFKSLYSLFSKAIIQEFGRDILYYKPTGELADNIDELVSAREREQVYKRIGSAYLELDGTPHNLFRAGINLIKAGEKESAFNPLFDGGTGYIKSLRYREAAEAFEALVDIIECSPEVSISIKAAKRLGLSRKYMGDFEGAREAYYRAMAIAEQAGDADQVASILSDIGVTYFEGGDPERAIELYERAINAHKSVENRKGRLFDMVNIAGAYQVMKETEKARKHYEKASVIAEDLDNALAKCVIGLNLGQLDIADGDFTGALPKILNSASIARDEGFGQFLFRALLSLAEIYRKQARTHLANKALDEAEEIAEKLGKRAIGATYIARATLHRIRGEYPEAVAAISNVGSAIRFLDKEESIAFAIEYALLTGLHRKLPEIPRNMHNYSELRPALDFMEISGKKSISKEDIPRLEKIVEEAVEEDMEHLATAANTLAFEYFISAKNYETARRYLDRTTDIVQSGDPYPLALSDYFRAKFYLATEDIAAGRHALSSANSRFKELGNEDFLDRIAELKKKLESPNLTASGDFARLLPIIKAMNSTLDTGELLSKILSATIELTGAERGIFIIVEKGGAEPLLAVTAEGERIEKSEISYSHGLVEEVLTAGEANFSEDIGDDSELSSRSSIIDMELTMALCVPVKDAEGKIQALIYADSRIGRGSFDRRKLDIISALADQAAVALRNAERFDALRAEKKRLADDFAGRYSADIIGNSEKTVEIKRRLAVVAPQNVSVLITGETGVGKELVARAIHTGSSRNNGLFVAVNCAALPETLLESELFGHEKGAFTGADSQHIGRFEQAEGGTVFLDEIAEMPISLQAKLLRVLESKKISRLGGSGEIDIDVRMLSATNLDPEEAIKENKLRSDLFYRISGVRINIPPLRERRDDIPELVAHFLVEANEKFNRDVASISRSALSLLSAYPWYGNIRELSSVIEEVVLFATGKTIRIEDLPVKIQKASREEITLDNLPESWPELQNRKSEIISAMEEQVLQELLKAHDWNVAESARAFKINRSQLHQLLSKYGIVTKE